MTSLGPVHPLDVDLADLVDGVVEAARASQLEAHLSECLLCRIKRERLRRAPPATPAPTADRPPLPSLAFVVPGTQEGVEPTAGELWVTGGDERILVLVVRAHPDRLLVAPVTLDVEAADEENVVVDAARSPLQTGLAIHPTLAAEVPRAVLAGRFGAFGSGEELAEILSGDGPGLTRGKAIEGPSDPRLELRQLLADRLASLEETPPDPAARADAPPARPEQVTSALIADLRAMRGGACTVQALDNWSGLNLPVRNRWVPMLTVDEVGIVLVVLDTPHGLVDEDDFEAARSVLTRFGDSALVVLGRALTEFAEVFDSPSLHYGIDIPSGAHTPPRPLSSGLAPFDAIAKFLDQHTGAKVMGPPSRGAVTRVDVGDILREAAAAAVADAVRQGPRFKIAPKRRGYESLAGAQDGLQAALEQAFTEESVVEDLIHLARRSEP
jgi:hypothetical protein